MRDRRRTTRSVSRIRPRAKPVFGDPLMADGPHVCGVIGPAPGGDESGDGTGDAQPDDDPQSIHEDLSTDVAYCSILPSGYRGRPVKTGMSRNSESASGVTNTCPVP